MTITGYRWYKLDEDYRLNPVAVNIGTADDHIVAPAVCARWCWSCKPPGHDAPSPHCSCGYSGYYKMADALLREHSQFMSVDNTALVEILAWGRIQHHRWGFRAERIALSAVFVAGEAEMKIADRYLCNKRGWSEAMEMLTVAQAAELWRIQTYYMARRDRD